MPQENDNTYKMLFSYPRMVSDLLTGFVRKESVSHLVPSGLSAAQTCAGAGSGAH
ncbi:hypothetical protein HH1059_03240 [Halorhodospira halochloris]|uniref:Uncharacterized protein n=1 Tax=Halorhodospira halochloris TaxID=1052 RepID=A0A2Z6EZC4_HALHR|nr:hypothetical protein HH1059_03240 [Halorhodospira halochloris]